MQTNREYSLAEIAVELQQPVEAIFNARSMLGIWPTRRDEVGQPFYDQKSLALIDRLLVQRDGTVLLEPRDECAWLRYLRSEGIELESRPLTAEEIAFANLVVTDVAAAEALLNDAL